MKIISWNVNGLRAWYKKGMLDWVLDQKPDFFCVQETKAEPSQLPADLLNVPAYQSFFNFSVERKGHSGVSIYSKIKPDKVTYGLGIEELDQQGRQINLFFGKNLLINCYFPNGGGPIKRLLFKLQYYQSFLDFVEKYRNSGFNVVFCGDLNVAHDEIDIARPESNKDMVGFLPEERLWIDELLDAGFIDAFRKLHPKTVKYSWWDMKTRARDRNIGWRLDYFFIDLKNFKKLKKVEILDNVFGSDHCPILLEL